MPSYYFYLFCFSPFLVVFFACSFVLMYSPSRVMRAGKQWVLSPYVDLNKRQINSTVAVHADGFKQLARTGGAFFT